MVNKSQLKRIVPGQINRFQKLQPRKNPSEFDKWDYDKYHNECLYYWVDGNAKNNNKRIPIDEIIKADKHYRNHNAFYRSDYERLCPVGDSAGGVWFYSYWQNITTSIRCSISRKG